MTKGLAPQTSELFDAVTRLDCIKPFVLVGGTALSLQLNARQSEDLDFMRWKRGPKDKLEVGWPKIKKELSTNNLRIADVRTIGALKMEVMLRRAKFRDYYDLYSILKSGIDIQDLTPLALEHSDHKLKLKNLLAMITNGDFFSKDSQFDKLSPVYDVTPTDIQEYIKAQLSHDSK